MISRSRVLQSLIQSIADSPVTILLGPRQSGKTTLARAVAAREASTFFDLELPSDRARLAEAELVLGRLEGLVIIDEVQLLPGLFGLLRPLADREPRKAHFLLLGSAAPQLMKAASESLAGRATFVDLGGLSIDEVGGTQLLPLWLRGGFPRSYLATTDATSFRWRNDFVRTFLERDIPQLGVAIPTERLLRFWTMLAHYHGQIWNGTELSRALGFSDKTLRGYLDLLSGAYVLRQLQPWHENLRKRQVKAPKAYVRDSGLLHALLAIESWHGLAGHPKFGASWEGFAIEQILTATSCRQAYFWSTHNNAELDLMLILNGSRYGFEFKASASPGMTKSLHVASADLSLTRSFIVYPGEARYPVSASVEAISLPELLTLLPML